MRWFEVTSVEIGYEHNGVGVETACETCGTSREFLLRSQEPDHRLLGVRRIRPEEDMECDYCGERESQ